MEEWKDNFSVITSLEFERYKNLCGEYDIQYCWDCGGIYKYYGCKRGNQSLSDYGWGKIFYSVNEFENALRVVRNIDEYSII